MPTHPDDDRTRDLLTSLGITTADPTPLRTATAGAGMPHSFAPGSVIGSRYRIVALLGRGGMGEVYRADDLTLDQPVALKFLPGTVAADAARLAQFHGELKTARQVSHKNVCRLYDLGEADGRRFLTMEYVDGEDLSSLLRRIGRIPHDKAIDMARQICAGVAAAHDRGVVHRDLKPANVMIDGDGNVRITDFGVATMAGVEQGDFAGTPQYMAPEQFEGRPASTRTDIYALGLILFEIFTGRRPVEAPTPAALKQFHQTASVTTPSSIVRDIDPAVERVIMRCLERDPGRRPVSALVVAAALPGADPLAAALAAGETPSPELLAAAAEAEAIPVRLGVALAGAALVGLVLFATLSSGVSFAGLTPLPIPPDVLTDRAQQVIRTAGYATAAGDETHGFTLNYDYIAALQRVQPGPDNWRPLAGGNPSALLFWYRSSPREMVPQISIAGDMDDPPLRGPDARLVVLDPSGRLRGFRSVPPSLDVPDAPATMRWDPLFAAAGLDLAKFSLIATSTIPRDFGDTRLAWEGPLGDAAGTRVRVEGLSYRGRAVSFTVAGTAPPAALAAPPRDNTIDYGFRLFFIVFVLVLFGAAALLARRNLRSNRADRRAATRLVTAVVTMGGLAWAIAAHHVPTIAPEFNTALRVADQLALVGVAFWTLYIALEPYLRRFWPDSLLGWSRLVSGHVRDPRVGHDLLVGVVAGTAIALAELAKTVLPPMFGAAAPYPTMGDMPQLVGSTATVFAAWLQAANFGIQVALAFAMLAVLLRIMIRWSVLRAVITTVIFALFCADHVTGTTQLVLLAPLFAGAVLTWLVLRRGLLAFAVALFVQRVLMVVPFTPEWSAWSAAGANWTLAGLMAMTLFAFYAARAAQPLLGGVLDQ